MSAYFVVQATITDEPQYQKYREAVVPFIATFGGKFAARGAKVDVLEGEHDTRSVVMFEFPTDGGYPRLLEFSGLCADQKAARGCRYHKCLGVSGRLNAGGPIAWVSPFVAMIR